jgi:AraC family transcriptional activator FtrA
MKKHRVAILIYDQLCTFEFACAVEIFALPRPELACEWYEHAVCAAESGKLRAAGGIVVQAPYRLTYLEQVDTVIIPGWRNIDDLPPAALLSQLRKAYARGARLCSICSGVFVLAAAGLLTGKTVTTHWRYAEKLAQRYPDIVVQSDTLYVDQGQIITSAGSAAGLDMLLHIVRKDYGNKIANKVAQRLVIPVHREGGQAQFLPRPLAPDEEGRLSALIDYLRNNPAQQHNLSSMANRAAMSVRTLQRQFQDATGISPMGWLIRERIGLAREMLENSAATVAQIAELTGFRSEVSFRQHFRRIVQTSPVAYQRRFSAAA